MNELLCVPLTRTSYVKCSVKKRKSVPNISKTIKHTKKSAKEIILFVFYKSVSKKSQEIFPIGIELVIDI